MKRLFAVVLLAFACLPPLAEAASKHPVKSARPAKKPVAPPVPQEIVLRHALAGPALDSLATLVQRFNDAEAKLKKGSGHVVLEDARGQADTSRLPQLALLDLDDAPKLLGARPRFLPLYRVMAADGKRFNEKQFYPQMADAVDDLAGRVQALPMGMSLPVLFYNKAAFAKAGLDPEHPPRTWWTLQDAAGALRDAGYTCPLTSSRFAWIHLENVAAQHGEPLTVKSGRREELALNNLVNVKHLALLTSWFKSNYFSYSGPGREGDARFASGECAMLTGESALYERLTKNKPGFDFGIAVLPHYDDVYGVQPTHVLPDGAALWVLAADNKSERQVIARFVAFLLDPAVQREWVRATGFLPMTAAAVQSLREAGVDPDVLDLAEHRLSMARDAARTRAGFGKSRIRAILDEEVEFVWGNRKPAKEALDTAVLRAEPVLSPPLNTARR